MFYHIISTKIPNKIRNSGRNKEKSNRLGEADEKYIKIN
jgi:hypothetical protein